MRPAQLRLFAPADAVMPQEVRGLGVFQFAAVLAGQHLGLPDVGVVFPQLQKHHERAERRQADAGDVYLGF